MSVIWDLIYNIFVRYNNEPNVTNIGTNTMYTLEICYISDPEDETPRYDKPLQDLLGICNSASRGESFRDMQWTNIPEGKYDASLLDRIKEIVPESILVQAMLSEQFEYVRDARGEYVLDNEGDIIPIKPIEEHKVIFDHTDPSWKRT